jgi:hypothetical protein
MCQGVSPGYRVSPAANGNAVTFEVSAILNRISFKDIGSDWVVCRALGDSGPIILDHTAGG